MFLLKQIRAMSRVHQSLVASIMNDDSSDSNVLKLIVSVLEKTCAGLKENTFSENKSSTIQFMSRFLKQEHVTSLQSFSEIDFYLANR